MGKNKRQKAITFMLAAIAGECAAILIIVVILVYTAPVDMTKKGAPVSAGQPVTEITPDMSMGEASSFNIEANVQLINTKIIVKEYIKLKSAPGAAIICLPSANKAATTVKSAVYNGKPVTYIRKGSGLTITQAQNNGILYLEYEITLGTKPEILSYSSNRVLLTNFLAVQAVYRNSSPMTIYTSALGDPYRYDLYSYKLQVKTDKAFTAYGPGKKSDSVMNGTRITDFEAQNMRDFPVVLYKNASVASRRLGNINIIMLNASSAGNYASQALQYVQNKIGPYPYKELFIVSADFPLRGMEFSNMIFLSEKCFNDQNILKRVLYHEIFHQWFYGIIATDQLNEPFMDEGLVTFLTSRAFGDKLPSSYNSAFMKMNLTQYKTKESYNKYAYVDAAAYFGQLERKMGNNFNYMLKRIYNDKKFKILYFDEFKRYLTEFSRGN